MEEIKKNSGLLTAVLLAGVALGAVVGVVLLSFFYPIFQSDKWAAWVQAVGSIGAIVGAIYTVRRPEAIRRSRERDVERGMLDQHIEILRHSALTVPNSLEELNNIYNQIHSPDRRFAIRYYGSYGQYVPKAARSPISTLSNTFDIPVWALKKIDIHTYPYIFLSYSTGQLIQLMENAKRHFQTAPYSSGFIDRENIDVLMDYLEVLNEDCRTELKSAEDIYNEKRNLL